MAVWVLACLLTASGSEAAQDNAGMGGADRIGVGVLGLSESAADIPEDEPLRYSAYIVKQGDFPSKIAEQFNVTLDTIVSFNSIENARGLREGQTLKIPNQSGILYQVKAGQTTAELAKSFNISNDRIIEANGLFSEAITESRKIFLPDAVLPNYRIREISGELFRWPVRGWVSSPFGYRKDPFSGTRSYHNGLDVAVEYGTAVQAAMEGTVVDTGYSPILGNYIGISHHFGYQTLYGHLSKISVKVGQYVKAGQYVGNAGTSGYSTGSHLHFSVLKNGKTINPLITLH
jgi:murein DD-endopeptidase MepM/ murein hydrolase activator NlpD